MARAKTIRRPEQAIQKAIFQHIRARGVSGLVAWHTPNGGHRKPIEGAILKSMGVRAGVSDIIAAHKGQIFALELKAEGGRATESQLAFPIRHREGRRIHGRPNGPGCRSGDARGLGPAQGSSRMTQAETDALNDRLRKIAEDLERNKAKRKPMPGVLAALVGGVVLLSQ